MRSGNGPRYLGETLIMASLMLKSVVENEYVIGLAMPLANQTCAGFDREIA